MTREEIAKILADHKEWRQSGGFRGARAYLADADLADAGGAVASAIVEPANGVAPAVALAPLAKTTLDDAWRSAVAILEAGGESVHLLTTGAAARVNGWRALGVSAFPDSDDSGEP